MTSVSFKVQKFTSHRLSDRLLLKGVRSDLCIAGEGDSHDRCDLLPSSSSSQDDPRISSEEKILTTN